jgi:hypothetical protein
MIARSKFPEAPLGRLTTWLVPAVEMAVSAGVPTTAGEAIYAAVAVTTVASEESLIFE